MEPRRRRLDLALIQGMFNAWKMRRHIPQRELAIPGNVAFLRLTSRGVECKYVVVLVNNIAFKQIIIEIN